MRSFFRAVWEPASTIVIPSLDRPIIQPTIDALNDAGIVPNLLVQIQDEERYRRSIVEKLYMAHLVVLPAGITTIGPTRQWILEQAVAQKMRKVIMMDDDLKFSTHRKKGSFTKSKPTEVRDCIIQINSLLNGFAHVGVGSRQGANFAVEDAEAFATHFPRAEQHWGYGLWATRMQRVLAYQPHVVLGCKASFLRTEPLSDFDMTLQLLRAGFPNAVLYNHVQDECTGGFNAKGGCSVWRTPKRLRKAQRQLYAWHKPYVKLIEKPNLGRTEVRIAWKQAYQSSQPED